MTSLTFFALCTRQSMFRARAAIALSVALVMAPSLVLAKAQVRGSREVVSIETQNASIQEILTALGAAFDVQYRSSVNLEKQLTGTYEGSLQRVVTRVLEGYNFIVKTSEGRIEIIVLGAPNTSTAPGKSSASTGSGVAPIAPAPMVPTPTSSKVERVADASASVQPSVPSKIAEGPVPTASSAQGPMPVPSGSGPSPFPEARPSTVAPPAPGSAPAQGPEPQASAVAPPVPGKPGHANAPLPHP
jgi:hypothetical protein